MDLPHVSDIIDDWDNNGHNWYGNRKIRDIVYNAEGRELINFCEKKWSGNRKWKIWL
jgi:hypothetical protein